MSETERQNPNNHQNTIIKSLIQCLNLIIPYLPPIDIASISSSCKTLHKITKKVTNTRSCDASRGFENFPTPFINKIDSKPYDFFYYTQNQTLPINFDTFLQPWGTYSVKGLVHDFCLPNTKICPRPDFYRVWSDPFLFRVEGGSGCECRSCGEECCCLDEKDELGHECGPSCLCGLECGNRVTQRGVRVKLKVVRDEKKGWSLYGDEFIGRCSFVCEYAGELLTTGEARRRQEIYDELASKRKLSPALLVVKEHLSSGNVCMRINIDATRIGNIARFINHSCDGGNLSPVIVRSSGALLPRVCFFASRDIQENEELTFRYGEARLKENGLKCFCGSSSCYGILPSENT
ncbi:histone modifying enzyme [Lithospermum erythrorhizon]|uniref:Histone modifying enzyme n=1 Tax=Lithospermum erythrorhizon TaxID=34254 RepID=A0AAV3NST2_LITER